MVENLYYRIATSQAGLESGANFFIRGIPRPDLAPFADFTQRFPQSQGGQTRQGNSNSSLFWSRLHFDAAGVLRGLIEIAEAGSGLLYFTLPRQDAKHSGVSWIDVSARPVMPEWTPLEEVLFIYENVTLRLNNVTVLATPSTVQT
jgi:hypothetical protein